jgi:hydrogenase maturation protein HypF
VGCRWRIIGRVQGVGFRPFVYRVATRMGITGGVWNDSAGIIVEAAGTSRQLADFANAIRSELPAAAAIIEMIEETISPDEMEGGSVGSGFQIRRSSSLTSPTAQITADLALCDQCLAEVRDRQNPRRYRYALTNCTNCGPRFSIIRAVPYDRPNTTMADFEMCGGCRDEYEEPADRRFHAQPIACQQCGPQLALIDHLGHTVDGDAVSAAARLLVEGKIVAIKGIGGFHLAVRADDEAAVARLRQLKHRPAKPFALMCASLEAARKLVRLSPQGSESLTSTAAPIVLATRVATAPVALAAAPESHRLGVMLAYTPLHHLIFDELRASGVETLVMTSGNDVDEPLVFQDHQATARLGDLCDAMLLHNRPIQRAVDDSVIIDAASAPIFLRRSRGYVPEPIPLPDMAETSAGLAVGAELKNTVAIARDGSVVLSQHLGSLTHASTFKAFKRAISDLCNLSAVTPAWIAHDLHPAYLSTLHAQQLALKWSVPLIPVQHHHAHAAAVLAEHGLTGPALAVVCDGTGYGTDGTIWGGELLLAGLTDFTRLGRLRPITLPGGDVSARQPWRSAMALLFMAFGKDFTELPICATLSDKASTEFVRQMLSSGFACISSSSTGRVFDGIAALLGLCRENRFDAEAPSALEAAASQAAATEPMPENAFRLCDVNNLVEIDLAPLVQKIANGAACGWLVPDLALLFHQTLAAAWALAVARAMHQTGLNTVALSGGAFCNELFGDLLQRRLEQYGAKVLRHQHVPCNDGGIAYGQAAVASARVSEGLR